MDSVDQATPTIYIIFGATGDLASRKLIPSLYYLYTHDALPAMFRVVGFARGEFSDEEYQERVRDICRNELAQADEERVASFSTLFMYRTGSFEDREAYDTIAQVLGKQDDNWSTCANKLFHLAVPPHYYETILQNLADSGLTEPCGGDEGWTRVIVEKPFGKDAETAQALDRKLDSLFKEEQIYRIDHYLGKETVRNVLAFRFSNAFLAPAWDTKSIESIHIHFFEEQGVAGRAHFYDGVGALRDVGQNHMLQLLSLFTMENPGAYDAASIREKRAEVLEALEIMDQQDVARNTTRAQYAGYRDIEGVSEDSDTETYFNVEARLHLPQWRGVPILLESGKALHESKVEVTVKFRHQRPCLCPPDADKHYTNILRYRIQPHEGIFTSFWVKKPGPDMAIEEKDFSFDYQQAYEESTFIDAYAKLIRDAITGDQTLFVSTREIMASWRFIDPIERWWGEDVVPLISYDSGSEPPLQSSEGERAMPKKAIGFVGLGKMGSNMVRRLAEYNWSVVASDPDAQARSAVEVSGVETKAQVADMVAALRSGGGAQEPVLIWLMVPHKVVDDVLEALVPHLQEGDTVIDGGNSFYKDSVRRAAALGKQGVSYLDVGVSGGPEGAQNGACLMVGGPRDVYKKHIGVFNDLATAGGFDYMGETGAGHFVKMVHNGIEYGMMQAIAEGFAVMKQWESLPLESVANVYNHGSVIESALVGWLKDAYREYGVDLDMIRGAVSHSGEGQWTVETAKEFGVPVRVIEDALQFRIDSQEQPSYTGKIVSALRGQFGGHDVRKA